MVEETSSLNTMSHHTALFLQMLDRFIYAWNIDDFQQTQKRHIYLTASRPSSSTAFPQHTNPSGLPTRPDRIAHLMSYPERSDIAQLREIQRKVDDAANNTIAAAAVMSNASDNASYAAVATADAKRTVDKAYAAAVTKAAEVAATNPSTVVTTAPARPLNNFNDASARHRPSTTSLVHQLNPKKTPFFPAS
jgi:hypothetical protein